MAAIVTATTTSKQIMQIEHSIMITKKKRCEQNWPKKLSKGNISRQDVLGEE